MLSLLPLITARAILLIVDAKITEQLKTLLDSGELLKEAKRRKLNQTEQSDIFGDSRPSSENMVILFCLGLFSNSFTQLDTANELRKKYFCSLRENTAR